MGLLGLSIVSHYYCIKSHYQSNILPSLYSIFMWPALSLSSWISINLISHLSLSWRLSGTFPISDAVPASIDVFYKQHPGPAIPLIKDVPQDATQHALTCSSRPQGIASHVSCIGMSATISDSICFAVLNFLPSTHISPSPSRSHNYSGCLVGVFGDPHPKCIGLLLHLHFSNIWPPCPCSPHHTPACGYLSLLRFFSPMFATQIRCAHLTFINAYFSHVVHFPLMDHINDFSSHRRSFWCSSSPIDESY